MKIIGIGTDMVSVERIEGIWARYRYAFARRILTKDEWEKLEQASDPVGFLAKRYAAKEATAKALGTGFRPEQVLLTEIGVLNDSLGRPYLVLTGGAEKEARLKGVTEMHVSLTDEKKYALAFVLLL